MASIGGALRERDVVQDSGWLEEEELLGDADVWSTPSLGGSGEEDSEKEGLKATVASLQAELESANKKAKKANEKEKSARRDLKSALKAKLDKEEEVEYQDTVKHLWNTGPRAKRGPMKKKCGKTKVGKL